ncbi:hypothetical protein ACFYMI_29265 [Streptomyces collinus]
MAGSVLFGGGINTLRGALGPWVTRRRRLRAHYGISVRVMLVR